MKSKIHIQLIIVYFGVLLVIVSAFYHYVSTSVFTRMQKNIIDNMMLAAESLDKQLDTYFYNADQVLLNMIYKGTLQQYIEEINARAEISELEKLVYTRKFDDLISGLSTFSIIPSSHITIYNKDLTYQYQYNKQGQTNLQQVLADKNMLDYLEKNRRIFCRQKDWKEDDRRKTYSVIRRIMNISGECLGYLELQLDYYALDHICSFEDGIQAYIITENGQMLYPARGEQQGELEFIETAGAQKKGTMQYENNYYAWEYLPDYDMFIVIRQNENILFESLNELKKSAFLICILIVCAAFPVLYWFLYKILTPIKKLTEQVVHVNYSSMEIEFHEKNSTDEVKVLQKAFAEMLLRIRLAAEKEIFFQRDQERMNYEILQKQIAPHFIHNTLYVISIAAQENRKEDVISMCKRLSNILRYSMNMQQMKVNFAEELNYIRDYIKIQEENYGEDFSYEIDVDECLNDMEVPRMFLQPFVENCFKHGFGGCEPPYFLHICGHELKETVYLCIEDNGVGIRPEIVERIEEKLGAVDFRNYNGSDSLGIVNTILRMKYIYGDRVNVILLPGAGGGTKVQVCIQRQLQVM